MENDLGVVVDNKLTFSQHINSTVVKANRQVVGMIRRIFKGLGFVGLFMLHISSL